MPLKQILPGPVRETNYTMHRWRASICNAAIIVLYLNRRARRPIFPLDKLFDRFARWKKPMMMLRVLGAWSLILAMVIVTIDGTKSLASGEGQWIATPLGEHWFKLHAPSLNTAQAAIERYVDPLIWDPVIVSLLLAPSWIVFAVLGLLLYWLGRKRRRIDMYDN